MLPSLLKKYSLNRLWPPGLVLVLFFLTCPVTLHSQVIRKTEVIFSADDGLLVTADKYYSKRDNPYIILLHTEGSSRGEYDSIAERFIRMNYNCLAVDLRSGYRHEFTVNETAFRAKEKGYNTSLYESMKDIEAAIDYLHELTDKPIILLGSSYSATLALLTGKYHPNIKSVIAFSPGDFFQQQAVLKDILTDYPKPAFAAFSATEFPFFSETLGMISNENITVFHPAKGNGSRTVESLFGSSGSSPEYWFALLAFFRTLH